MEGKVKKSVGLVVIIKKAEELYAVLQKRSAWNHEKDAPESFPGCLQVTCHGKLEEDESFVMALVRECMEELGKEFTQCVQIYHPVVKVFDREKDGKHVITYATMVKEQTLSLVSLGQEVEVLIHVSKKDVEKIIPITDKMKKNGAPAGEMAMFSDEIEAVKAALEIAERSKM